ncbi:hypothetical protein AgCh_022737 [Apium graveolens]
MSQFSTAPIFLISVLLQVCDATLLLLVCSAGVVSGVKVRVCDELGWRKDRGSIGMVEYDDGLKFAKVGRGKVMCGMAIDLHHGLICSDSRWKMEGIIAIVSMVDG